MKTWSLLLSLFLALSTLAHADINMADVDAMLKGSGLKGEIHGASNDGKLFVITYRNPTNFFENVQLPLTSEDAAIMDIITKTKRHQFYIVKGELLDNKAPVKHIKVTSIEMAKDYSSELDHMPYKYRGDLNDLYNMTEFTGRVHAVGAEGKMLVMEYKDRIIPVFVTEESSQNIVKTFYRGDLVKVKFRVRAEPEAPTHLGLQITQKLPPGEKPVELLESLVKTHGNPIEKTGSLIRFPKSPQIQFDIYALLAEDAGGTTIQYTLVNFDDPALFKKIREKLEKAWMENSTTAENDRNKLVNRKLVVHAKGISNMVDAGQANPQILINSIDDLTVEVVK